MLREKRILPWEREREKGGSLKRPLVSSPRREKDPFFVHVGRERGGIERKEVGLARGEEEGGKEAFSIIGCCLLSFPSP